MTRVESMRQYKAEGHTAKQTAIHFGVSSDYVRKVCRGIAPQTNKNDEKTVAQKIRDKSGGQLEYVSGYTIKEKPVKVRCNICGGEFERTFHNLTTKGGVSCPICIEHERAKRKAEAQAERERKRFKAEANKSNRNSQLRLVICSECGDSFFTWSKIQKYCCKDCRKSAAKRIASYNQGSDDRLNRGNIVDRDIDLRKLYDRDRGVCQICGGCCDYSDYYYNENGVFIAGEKYPSKDHIVPLSLGGKHSWDNVRLAHRGCNTKYFQNFQKFMPSPGREFGSDTIDRCVCSLDFR